GGLNHMLKRTGKWVCLLVVAAGFAPLLRAATPSDLYLRGYNLIPAPQKIELKSGDLQFDSGWRLETGKGVKADDVAVESLKEGLETRHGITLETRGRGKAIALEIRPGSVEIGEATDKDRKSLEEQAYKLEISNNGIRITANAPAGLLYGAETLVQLVKRADGKQWLPEATITDWPDVRLREVFWDEQMHLDRPEVLKQAIRRAAFFKLNGFALRLNGHFEYASAPALVDPYALSPAQLQDLTDYGLRYHVQVIPYVDGPAHVNWILERQEYKKLREFPQTAFQMCSSNPETYKLLEGLYQDLMNANKGVQYFHLSTDEAWFIGKADNDQCRSAEAAKKLGSPSKLLVDYIQKTAGYLHDHGRKVIFWGEDPLQAEDIPLLPSWLINGEIYSPAYNKAFRAHGIQQMIYTNSLPDRPLFPGYFVLSPNEQVHPHAQTEGQHKQVFNEISYTSGRQESDVIGVDIYAWGDLGPHPETYWLGYAVGAAAAWHPASPGPLEVEHNFYRLFYGKGSSGMDRLYQLLSTQAQFFASSWDSKASDQLPLIFGYSYGIGPFVPHIQTLPLPPVPSAGYLHLRQDWSEGNARRMQLANKFLGENDELLSLLYRKLPSVQFNRYNLEVYLSLAEISRQNLKMLQGLEEISNHLEAAQKQAEKLQYQDAVRELDGALDTAKAIRDNRNQVLHDASTIWYKSIFPRVREANGRHVARDPQDFVSVATSAKARRSQSGLGYMIDREFSLPLGDWFHQVQEARNRYAAEHNLPAREDKFDWMDTSTLHSLGVNRDL
ncbi:MAG TPA: glycoside hydrolase family 20 zincin-like fold domain-containing protein, partial [Terriglobia bacterium]|nr:glycoside hydrolase family 20 zincin-like fold domain-containing protein [Terriglobia bacterium]